MVIQPQTIQPQTISGTGKIANTLNGLLVMSVERRLDAIEYQLGRIAEATTEFRQDLAEIKGMIREQAETTKQQAEIAKQQAETVARLVGIVERSLTS